MKYDIYLVSSVDRKSVKSSKRYPIPKIALFVKSGTKASNVKKGWLTCRKVASCTDVIVKNTSNSVWITSSFGEIHA